MRIDEFRPKFLTDKDSKEIATRQILSFLSVNDEERKKRAPSKALFSLSKIPPDAFMNESPFLKWQSRQIHDVDGALLFWDQSIKLDDANTLTVRTAGSNLLRTPVWSVRAGKTIELATLITKTQSALNNFPDLEPVLVDHAPQLICYAYPKLGILAGSRTQPSVRFVLDLWERKPFPVEKNEHHGEPDANDDSVHSIWSPYDLVTRATVARFRARWENNFSSLNAMPEGLARLTPEAAAARLKTEEKTTNPELHPVIYQETPSYCVPATMAMILRHHCINRTQGDIATEMGTSSSGTPLGNQADRIDELTDDALVGELDLTASFADAKAEIIADRPFKTGGQGHARACCGYMIEDNVSQTEWLYIYDPMPVDSGDVYFESWEALYHGDYIYVKPMPSL
jgi:hypothetical protein